MRKLILTLLALLTFTAPAFATSGTAMPGVKHQFFDANGDPCDGCLLFFYASGTSTKQTAYSDAALGSSLANPYTLDAAGRVSGSGDIFFVPGQAYKVVLAPADDTDPPAAPLWTVDGVQAVPPASTSADVDVSAVAGENLASGEVVYLSDGGGGATSGRWYRADADQTYSSNLAPALGVANAAISTGSTGTVRRVGRVTGLTGLVAGSLYYASATAGALTATKPTNARSVGTADSTTTLILAPSDTDTSATLSGNLNTGAQPITGEKTFSSAIVASAGVKFPSTNTLANLIYARSSSDFTKNNNTTLGDVTGLSFAVGASEVWTFRFSLKAISAGAADFKFALTGPSAPTAVIYGVINANASISTSAASAFATAISTGSGGSEEWVIVEGTLRNGANAGTVQLQFAQNTLNASDSIIRAESYVMAWKIQ